MSELFEIYNSNIKKVFNQLEDNFNTLKLSSNDNDSTNNIFSQISTNLNEAQKLLRNLDIEISSESHSSDYYLIVKKHRATYNKYLKNLRKLKEKFENENKEILLSDLNKKKLGDNNEEIAYNSFNKLNEARRSTIEMENVGYDVMKDMNGQSIQMKNLNSKIGNVGDELVLSTNVINEMQKHHRKNKIIIISYSLFLTVIFFLIALYRIVPKFFDFSSNNEGKNVNPSYNNNIINNTSNITSIFE
jgi:hypothetical protein